MSPKPTRYAVWCTGSANPPDSQPCSDELIYLTPYEYKRQMQNANESWKCPRCGSRAIWDDENYERESGAS